MVALPCQTLKHPCSKLMLRAALEKKGCSLGGLVLGGALKQLSLGSVSILGT